MRAPRHPTAIRSRRRQPHPCRTASKGPLRRPGSQDDRPPIRASVLEHVVENGQQLAHARRESHLRARRTLARPPQQLRAPRTSHCHGLAAPRPRTVTAVQGAQVVCSLPAGPARPVPGTRPLLRGTHTGDLPAACHERLKFPHLIRHGGPGLHVAGLPETRYDRSVDPIGLRQYFRLSDGVYKDSAGGKGRTIVVPAVNWNPVPDPWTPASAGATMGRTVYPATFTKIQGARGHANTGVT